MSVLTQFVTYFADGLRSLAGFFAFLGDQRWVAAIIALTIIIRTALLPLAIKQIRSMRDTQRLQPEMQRIRQKYRNDRQAMNQELMALYQREGVNPMAACLPLIIQMPILIAINAAIRRLTAIPLETLQKMAAYSTKHGVSLTKAAHVLIPKVRGDVLTKVKQISDYAHAHHTSVVSAAERLHIVQKMPFFGFGDLSNAASHSLGGWLLIIIMTVLSLLSAMQLNFGATEQQRRMQLLTPLFITIFFIRFPTALLLYWTTQQLYQYVQQSIMTREMRKESGGFVGNMKATLGMSSSGTAKTTTRAQSRPERLRPAAAVAGGGTALDSAARRDLEEKRRRRRNNKKKKKRRK